MTYEKLINQIMLRMGNRMGLKSQIEETVEVVKEELEDGLFHPFFLISEDTYFFTVVDEPRVPVPEKFLAEYEGGALWIESDGKFTPLKKIKPEEFGDRSISGKPEFYTQMGEYYRLFPSPDKEYTIRTFHYVGTDLLTNSANPWLSHGYSWLMWSTIALLSLSGRDKNWSVFEGKAANAKLEVEGKTIEREMSNYEISMGENPWD